MQHMYLTYKHIMNEHIYRTPVFIPLKLSYTRGMKRTHLRLNVLIVYLGLLWATLHLQSLTMRSGAQV